MGIYVAVVEEGGFAAAARRLGVSPPVVTRAVAELEEATGVRLLTRTTRVVRVTEVGARYADDCRRILAEVAEADEAAAGSHATPRGHLEVTAPALFGRMYVTPIVTEYLGLYPGTDVAALLVDRVVNLDEEGIDAAVRIGDLADSSLQAVRVGRVRRVVCAAPAYLEKFAAPTTPRELVDHSVISAGGVTPSSQWKFFEEQRPRTVTVRPRLVTTTNDSAIAAAIEGFGLTRVLSYQVARELEDGTLVALLEAWEPPPLPIHLVYRGARRAAGKVRAFVDLAVARLRADRSLR